MASYKKNGARQYKLDRNKNAIKQLENFTTIMHNMSLLNQQLEEFPGHLTEDNIKEVAEAINKTKQLKLDDNQVNIVVKKFTEPTQNIGEIRAHEGSITLTSNEDEI